MKNMTYKIIEAGNYPLAVTGQLLHVLQSFGILVYNFFSIVMSLFWAVEASYT
jgi:hypothetical protein